MKKHITGLALFSFIVSAAVVFAFFNVPEIVPVSEVIADSAPQYVPPRSSCQKKLSQKNNSLVIKQAVFKSNSKTVYITLDSNKLYENDYKGKKIRINFFIKNADRVKFIASEEYKYVPQSKFYGEAFDEIISFHSDWLKKIDARDNLYVVAEVDREYSDLSEQIVFDPDFASPVTLFSERKTTFQRK